MTLSFLYLAFRALLGALVRSRGGLDAKDVELLVLRHKLDILRRHVARPKLAMADRALLAAAVAHLPRASRGVVLVTPRTLLRWHQAQVRRKWRQPVARVGRPVGCANSIGRRSKDLKLTDLQAKPSLRTPQFGARAIEALCRSAKTGAPVSL